MRIDEEGFLSGEAVLLRYSPFFDDRPERMLPELIIIHNISLPAGCFGTGYPQALFEGTLDTRVHPTFDSLRGLKVSSHFLITRNGQIEQFVSTQKRAWHAGVSNFQGRNRCNDFSVGIELEGSDFVAFEPIQYERLAQLLEALHQRYEGIRAITGHQDVAPERKTDPGPFFDWAYLEKLVKSLPITLYHEQRP